MKPFHFHKWRSVTTVEQLAPIEVFMNAGEKMGVSGLKPGEIEVLSRQSVIVTYECECGATKVERI